jgi:hypothetical protein
MFTSMHPYSSKTPVDGVMRDMFSMDLFYLLFQEDRSDRVFSVSSLVEEVPGSLLFAYTDYDNMNPLSGHSKKIAISVIGLTFFHC